jgi:predicted permease
VLTFRSLASRFSALFRRRELEDRVDEELRFHLRMQTEENIRRGMDPQRAWAAAHRKIGNTTQICEEVHRMNTIEFLEETARNFRLSFRTLRRNPGFVLTAVLVLALGLGASTAMFSALDRILFRPLPYADADQLVNVGMTFPAFEIAGKTPATLNSRGYQARWKPAPEPFTAVSTIQSDGKICDVTEGQPERLFCATVESNFLQMLGVRPALGRDFTPEDDTRGAPLVAIVSHEVWTRRFGADPSAIGRTIHLNGRSIPVIGVLPAGFAMPAGAAAILQPQQLYPADPKNPILSNLTAFGRLKPGWTPEQAEATLAPLIEAEAKELPGMSKGSQPRVTPLRAYLVGDASRAAWLLLGAVAGLLLIACVNVANLFLARLSSRNLEFAVRSALGAGRARLARMALTESLLLAIAGGCLGLLFAAAMLRFFVQLAPSSIPDIDQASLDLRVFIVAAVLTLAAGAAVGIWPALSVLRSRAFQYGPRATAAAHPRVRFALVTAQIALTVAMLGGSALMLRTLWNTVKVPLGYESERVFTMNVALNVERYPSNSRIPFFEQLLERVRGVPGGTAATMTSMAFPTNASTFVGFAVDSQPRDQQRPGISMREVTPGYFQTFGIPILRGRAFVEADRGAQGAVILSESAAQILFPGQDPIGHTVQLWPLFDWAEVVGIVREIRNDGLTREPKPELYIVRRRDGSTFTYAGQAPSIAFFAIRTQAGAADVAAFLKQAVADLDPLLPVTVDPLDEEVARLTERPRFIAWLLSVFAGLALLLAAAGLYGVASYLVTQRTRDIGVRIALGAAPADISRQVLREAGRWIAAGAALGCAFAWTATRAIEAQLYGVGSRDPLSWIAALIVLCVALLLAVLRPATRAARLDPMEALRAD